MQITEVQIERFMGLRYLYLDIAGDIQLVAGSNNAGKTSVLKALEFFFEPESYAIDEIRPKNPYYDAEGSRALIKVKLTFSNLTDSEKTEFRGLLPQRGKQKFWLEARMTRKGKVSFHCRNKNRSKYYHDLVASKFQIVHVPAVRVGRGGADLIESQRLLATIRNVLNSRRGRMSSAQDKYNKHAKQALESISKLLAKSQESASEVLPLGSSFEFSLPEPTDLIDDILGRVQLVTRPDEGITLAEEGTGLQSILSLGLLHYISSQNNISGTQYLFLIEEPEAFLHPQYQRAVADHLHALALRAQVLVTTHSAVVVDSFPIANVLRLHRDDSGLKYRWVRPSLDVAEAGRLSRYCNALNSELVFADCAILCEGITDKNVIETLVAEQLGEVDGDLNISVIDMGSLDNGESFIPLCMLFDVPYLLIADKDFYAAGGKKVNKLLRACSALLEPKEEGAIERLRRQECGSLREAASCRNAANVIFRERGIFTLSADIEAAVCYSYSPSVLPDALGPSGVGHLKKETVDELKGTNNGPPYFERLRQAIGSKGWNTVKVSDSNKPKPHVLKELVISAPGNIRKYSDLERLKSEISAFLTEHAHNIA